MSINKPYKRIWRPVKDYDWAKTVVKLDDNAFPTLDYLYDDRFANQEERKSLLIATRLIMHDLNEIFNFIEPCDDNLSVYSHQIYELLLRAATEFESNCKGILKSNNYAKDEKKWTVEDYYKISKAAMLSEYKVTFVRWATDHEFKPFKEWPPEKRKTLSWYNAYNKVKHDRYTNFKQATLDNLMNAVAGLLCILHAQYGEGMATVGFNGFSTCNSDEGIIETELFTIIAPKFPNDDQYDFIWDSIEKDANPTQDYPF
jgi:hypothetical protein